MLNGSAIGGGGHAIFFSEVVDEVGIRAETYLFQNLLHGEKRCPQHLLSLAQPEFFEVLSRTRPRLLLEEMAEARRRQIYQPGQSRSVPRGRSFVFEL